MEPERPTALSADEARQLEELIFEHGAAVDEKRSENIADLYVTEGALTIQGRRIVGTGELNAYGAARMADTARRVKHVVTNIRHSRTGVDSAEGRCIFTAYEVFDDPSLPPSVIAVGDYFHRFERRPDGHWLIAERTATW